MSSFGYGSLVFGTRDNSSGNVANTLIQFNSIQERKREKKAKALNFLYSHGRRSGFAFTITPLILLVITISNLSFSHPPSLSLFSSFFLLLSILSVSLQFLDNPSRELTHPHSTCHFFRKSHPIIALFLFRHSHFISHKI